MKAPSERHFIHGGTFVLANRLQQVGDRLTGDITTKQWFLLVAINTSESQPPNITDLARDLGASRQNTAKMLAALARKGYVALTPDPGDQRSHTVRLTGRAGEKMRQVSDIGEGFIARLFAGVSDEEVAAGAGLMRKLFANLGQMEQATDDPTTDR